MANAREIKYRIKSIQDTMKITKAMYMISSTKLKKAKQSLEETEPYFYTLQSELGRIVRHFPDIEHIYFDNREEDKKEKTKRKAYIVVTADKGLAGAYNHNVLKLAQEKNEKEADTIFYVVGEVGRAFFAGIGLEVTEQFHYTAQNPTMHRARLISEKLIDAYLNEEFDELSIIYTRMLNSIQSETECIQLLPLKRQSFGAVSKTAVYLDIYQEEFVMYPSPQEVLDMIVPNYITGFIFGSLVESYSSEQNARMTAMEAANKSANDMLHNLGIQYNRVRQTAITQELNEVIGGAKALKRKKKQ